MSLTRRDTNSAFSRQGRGSSRSSVAPLPIFHGVSQLKEYTIDKKLGQGTFGIVYKGYQNKRRHLVAIKQVLQRMQDTSFPVTAFREISILKALRGSDNIVELIDVIFDVLTPELKSYIPGNTYKTGQSIFMVFPYMAYDLTGILQNPSIELSEADRKSIMKQLFDGIDYIHQNKFLHRDIKASNILINHNGLLKIADFGLAREYHGAKPSLTAPGGGKYPLTEVVMTRWYRAPEVLFGDRLYTTAVDLWGIGCVLGELYEKEPILRGTSDIDQGYIIFKLCGTPKEDVRRFREWKVKTNAKVQYTEGDLRIRFEKSMSPEACDLLKKLLAVDPRERITTEGALKHEWFQKSPKWVPRVECNFPECHEADAIRHKEERKAKSRNRQTNGQVITGNNGYLPKELKKPQTVPQPIPQAPASTKLPSIPTRPEFHQQAHTQLQPQPQVPKNSQPQSTYQYQSRQQQQQNGLHPPLPQGPSQLHYQQRSGLPGASALVTEQAQRDPHLPIASQPDINGQSQVQYPTRQRYNQKDRYSHPSTPNSRPSNREVYYQQQQPQRQTPAQPQQQVSVTRSTDQYQDSASEYPQHQTHHIQRNGYDSQTGYQKNNNYKNNGNRYYSPMGYGGRNNRNRDGYYHDRDDGQEKKQKIDY